ncbi:hypothetical protein [Radicibacter daui]|uniref:hypothetical protein n=1 Tax=Radicibacter daui TaxID=3064829 RepID=UPI0040468F23
MSAADPEARRQALRQLLASVEPLEVTPHQMAVAREIIASASDMMVLARWMVTSRNAAGNEEAARGLTIIEEEMKRRGISRPGG